MLPRQDARPAATQRRAAALFAHALLVAGSLAALALALVATEAIARWWDPGYLVRTRGLHVYSRSYGWAGRPRAATPMGNGWATLNARGFRGRELPRHRGSGHTRVVVLGDSVAFGYGVSDAESFPAQLDARANGLDAANLGVQGYGPGQELEVLRREGIRQDPDVVVLAFCLRNDFVDAVLPVALYDGVTPRPVFRLDGDRLVLDESPVVRSAAGRAIGWLGDHSQLFNRAKALVPRRPEDPTRDWRSRKREAMRDPAAALRLTVAIVLEMDRLCRERGVTLLVATFPNGLSYEMETELASGLLGALAGAGVPTVDMAERFRAAGATAQDLALDRTGHLSARGHALAAEILEREIVSLAL